MGAADPGLFALKAALRAAIVVPVAFAFSLSVVGSDPMALFAAFGSMALLVFVDFGGSRRARLRAYVLLVLAGAPLIALGTLCSRSAWLATAVMVLVAFAILFAGVLDEYVAAAHSAAVLPFVLAVMVPAQAGAIPMRLAGWALAGALSIAALMLLWPERPRDAVRVLAARTARALAELVEGDAASRAADAQDAMLALRRRFVALEHRPSGTGGPTAALVHLVEDLGWLTSIATRPAATRGERAFARDGRELEAAVGAVLRRLAERLELSKDPATAAEQLGLEPALERLRAAHDTFGRTLVARFRGPLREADEARVSAELDEAYRLRQLSFGTLRAGRDALLAVGVSGERAAHRERRARIDAARRLARVHTDMRSVWLRDSIRGALGLGLAALIGQLSDLQHAFWIVLGTMTVLRSNALATGTRAAWALLGTCGGLVVGGLLVLLVGDDRAALWAILPFAILLAAYAPRAISFAAGQAGFSFTVLILFNLIEPVGWKVGIVRVEDVLIGVAVSLLAGAVVWPRGAAAVLRQQLGTAYLRATQYLEATIDALLGEGRGGSPEVAEREAAAAGELVDASVRDYLAERGSARRSLGDLAVLLAGAARVRLVAELLLSARSFARLTPAASSSARLADARASFDEHRAALCGWYEAFGTAIARATSLPRVQAEGDGAASSQVVLDSADESQPPAGLAVAWADRHLTMLAEREQPLAEAIASIRAQAARGF
jgi:uncharacterized membrane protein YccC